MDIIIIFAYLLSVFSTIDVIVMPAFFGKDREKFSFKVWIVTVIEWIMILSISLRLIGRI